MRMITVSGPPSSGKTSVISRMAEILLARGDTVGVAKFDCLATEDDLHYEKLGLPVVKGLSKELCPDHFFITNIEDVYEWGVRKRFDCLITESAGLCNRCSPHIQGVLALCVIDQLSGIHTPSKVGPMLRMADVIAITKSDIVSQAEREVFAMKTRSVNPGARLLHINGLSGQGAHELCRIVDEWKDGVALTGRKLRFAMPMANCSYCLGETKIGKEYHVGNVRKMQWEGEQ